MLKKLKNLEHSLSNAGVLDELDELVELAAYGRMLAAEYKEQGVSVPKWLTANLETLASQIKARARAEKELKKLREELG